MKKAMFVATVLAASSLFAQAELVSKDWIPGSGDQMITYDTDSKLEWLNIHATAGKTLDAVRRGPWVRQYGFRPATRTEVGTLFAHAGLRDDGYDIAYTQPIEALHLAFLLGVTINTESGNYSLIGMTATPFNGPDVLPPVGQVFTPQHGRINVLYDPNAGTPVDGQPVRFLGEAHFTGGAQTSIERNPAIGTFLTRTCKATTQNKC